MSDEDVGGDCWVMWQGKLDEKVEHVVATDAATATAVARAMRRRNGRWQPLQQKFQSPHKEER